MATETLTLKSGKPVKLGRIRPIEIVETDKMRVLIFPGGKAKATIKLGKYFAAERDKAPPPAKVDWYTKADASMKRVYLNDQYGDCVIAGKYHQVGVWTANDNTQGEKPPTLGSDQEVLSMYHTICGPGDNGCNIPDVLDYFQQRGLPFGGVVHKIDGYVSIDWTKKLMVQVALEVLGSLTLGINLPGDWTCTDCIWDVTNSRIVGGHDVCAVGYDEKGVQIATWGGIVTITWAAFLRKDWVEECYAELSPDWYGSDKLAANGIDAATLLADLQKLGGGVIPEPGPGPTPPVCPPGQHLDPVTNQCVPDITPPPPVTMYGIVHIPAIPCDPWGWIRTHPIDIPVTVSSQSHMTVTRVPPWLIPLLKTLCSQASMLPPPLNLWASIVCGLVPKNMDANLTLPPWFLAILRSLCAQASSLPPPYSYIAMAACGLLPTTINLPCGGCK